MRARILIVEDDPNLALGLQRGLKSLGYEVVGIAENGRKGITAAATLNPDLVLTDIGLGDGVDGVEVATAVRDNERIPVIFVTAWDDNKTIDRAMEASPFGYIVKPFEMRQLQAAIRVALCRHKVELGI